MARKNPSHLTNYMIRGKIMSDLISNVISLDLWHHNTMIFLTCQVVLYIFLQNFFIFILLSAKRPKLICFLRFLSIHYTNIDIYVYIKFYIFWRLSKFSSAYSAANCPAIAPSDDAVTICRRFFSRTSPAAKIPLTLVCIFSSVTI